MIGVWKASRASTIEVHHDKYNDDATAYSDDESGMSSSSGYSYSDDESEEEDLINQGNLSTNHIQGIYKFSVSKKLVNF